MQSRLPLVTMLALLTGLASSCSTQNNVSGPGGASTAGPRIQPLTVRPWNGTETSVPTPAPVPSASRYVNGRSSESLGTATQTSTGPASSSAFHG